MRGVNKVILVGTAGRDPESHSFAGGGVMTKLSIATSEQWNDKNTGEKKEQTEWHNVVFNGKLAEIAAEYLRKGSKVYIEGKLTTRKWQDKTTGQDRYSTEIRADQMQMLDDKKSGSEPAPRQQRAAPQPAPGGGGGGEDFDDLHFAPVSKYVM